MGFVPLSNRSAAIVGALIVLVLARPADGQRVIGNVVEVGTDVPVASAGIVIFDEEGREVSNTSTDVEGWFQVAMAAPGPYTIRVTHIAYTTLESQPLDLDRGETVEIVVRLGVNVIPLEPLEVTTRSASAGRLAEFYDRLERNAFGRFIVREDIELRPSARVTDLLRVQPGVQIRSARRGPFESPIITMRGCEPNIYIDGIRVRQSPDFPIDDLLTPEMVEGVEIYSSGAGAPAQYQQASQCGVVLFWTRQGEPGRPFSWKRLAAGLGIIGGILFLFVR